MSKPEKAEFSPISPLDLFKNPPLQVSVESGAWKIISPHRQSRTEVLQFTLPASDEYLDFFETFLEAKIRGTKADGTNLDDDPANIIIQPSDALFTSLFKNVTLTINGASVEHAQCYGLRAYVQTLLALNGEMKKTYATASAGWFADANLAKDAAGLNVAATLAR
jgi:hypothetical protein